MNQLQLIEPKSSKCYPIGMPRKDFSQIAFDVVQQAIGEVVPEPIDDKKKATQESGRRGGLKGGTARAAPLLLSNARRLPRRLRRRAGQQLSIVKV